MLKRMRLSHKLLVAFIAVALIPLIAMGIIALNSGSRTVEEEIFSKLAAVRDNKRLQIEDYFEERLTDTKALVVNPFFLTAGGGLWSAYDIAGMDNRLYQVQKERQYGQLSAFASAYGYTDLIMIGSDGSVFFTVAEHSDLGANIYEEPLASTTLAAAARAILEGEREWALTDFAPYAPDGDQVSAFLLHEFTTGSGAGAAVVALKLPPDAILEVMDEVAGMGDTGETILVGPDRLMRSDSRFVDGRALLRQRADTPAITAALEGETGNMVVTDYRGVETLAAYTPLRPLGELNWALVAKMDAEEAFAPLTGLASRMVIVALASLVGVIIVALLLSRAVTRPVASLLDVAQKVAEGDLRHQVTVTSHDEIGQLGEAVNGMVANLRQLIGGIAQLIRQITDSTGHLSQMGQQAAAASEQISQLVQQLADGARTQSTAAQESSGSMEELRAAISSIADGAQNQAERVERTVDVIRSMVTAVGQVAETSESVAEASQASFQTAQEGGRAVRETIAGMGRIRDSSLRVAQDIEQLGSQSQRIGEIVSLIDEIADQTNLLALNAAIEAARAGEHGRGFAVVAEEVRKLAERAGAAARDITELVKSIQGGVQRAVEVTQEGAGEIERGTQLAQESEEALAKILHEMEQVTERVRDIAGTGRRVADQAQEALAAIDEVASITEENTASTEEMAATSDQVVEVIARVAGISHDTAAASEEVSASIEQVAAGVRQVSQTAAELARMAEELKEMASRFRLELTPS